MACRIRLNSCNGQATTKNIKGTAKTIFTGDAGDIDQDYGLVGGV